MTKHSSVKKLSPEELAKREKEALVYAAEIREDNIKDIKKKNDQLMHETQNLEKELAFYESLEDKDFLQPEGNFQFERMVEFGALMKDMKISNFKREIAKNHERINVNNTAISHEERKVALLREGVNIEGMSDAEILAK